MEDQFHVNWIAVVVAALVPMIVGAVWYHPKVLGGIWMKANGFTEEDLRGGNPAVMYGSALVLAFLLAFFMMINVTGFGQEDPKFHTFQHGVAHATMLTLLVILPVMGTNAIFEKRKLNGLLVNVGYWWVALAIGMGILSAWR